MAKEKTRAKKTGVDKTTAILAILVVLSIITAAYIINKIGDLTNQKTPTEKQSLEENKTKTTTIKKIVEEGDTIEVDYTLKYPNNTIIDTSNIDTAVKTDTYNENKTYEPISFTVGAGELPPGIEEAALGMEEGEEKTVELLPEKAYGEWDPTLVEKIPRTRKIPLISNHTIEEFINITGEEPTVNKTINPGEGFWPVTVLDVIGDTVILFHNVTNETPLVTVFGNAILNVSGMEADATLPAPNIGDEVFIGGYYARVLDVNKTTVVLDYNHKHAGKTLVFTIKVESISKNET